MDLVREIIASRFCSSTDKLRIGDVPIDEIVTLFGTPLFVYNAAILEESFNVLRSVFSEPFSISYSVKANPNPHIIKAFIDRGCGLEIASGGELYLALSTGCDPSKLLFAGPGKTEDELKLALSRRVGEIHVESFLEAQRLNALSRHVGVQTAVALRVNPNSSAQGGAMQMGGKAAPFGIDEEQVDKAVEALSALRSLDFHGLHFYLGTQILDHKVLVRQYRHALEIAKHVAMTLGRPLKAVDFGGGLGIPYFSGERALDMKSLQIELQLLMVEVNADGAFDGTHFIIEPGRYLVGESGIYVVRVNDVKTSRGKKYAVVDGGMNHHLAASGNLGQVIKRNFPVAVVNKLTHENRERVDIVGPLCTPLDTLARDLDVPEIEVGDWIGVFQSGAYARTASPLQFLSYPSPAEIIVKNGRAHLIRRRGVLEDSIRDIPNPLD